MPESGTKFIMKLEGNFLKRFFNGHYSRRDYRAVKEIFDRGEDGEIGDLLKSHWVEFKSEKLPETGIDHILHSIHHKIRLAESSLSGTIRLWRSFQKVAAILIFPVVFGILAYFMVQQRTGESGEAYVEVQCPMGVRTKFHLPDGTVGYLNSGSTLKYPLTFSDMRHVVLSGEAFFEVSRDPKKPFHVETGQMTINVTGTEFNVIAWPEDDVEEVILQSGSLDVYRTGGTSFATLAAGQRLILDKVNGKAVKSNVIAGQYTGWKEGKLYFRNEDMEQVAKRLSRWYNAEVVIADQRLNQYSFHATFEDEQLDEVLKLLALTTPILHEERERVIREDGTYGKRKIVLKLNPRKIKQFK
jgi:transmembrane sensor